MRQNKLAAAVVVHKDRVLVVRRSEHEGFMPKAWGVPCGKLEPDEIPAVGVLRELEEETGLSGRIRGRAGQSRFFSEWQGRDTENVQINYLIQLSDHLIRLSDDQIDRTIRLPEPDQEFRWVPISELDHADLDAHNLKAIKQALSVGS
jgi:8-oxo-dGTP diphosphatase